MRLHNVDLETLEPRVAYFAGRTVGFADAARALLAPDEYADLVWVILEAFNELREDIDEQERS